MKIWKFWNWIFQAPDPNTLTTETLLKNSTFSVVESTTSFLSLVTVNLTENCEQYTKVSTMFSDKKF